MIRATQPASWHRIASSRLAIGLIAVLTPGLLAAGSQDYILEFPAKQMIAYKIEFEVPHPGRLAMEMSWSGNRVISFKLQGPDGSPPEIRRSGPPPLRLHHDVDPELASRPGQWKLSIRGLPAHEAASGMLTLYLPDPTPAPGLEPAPPSNRPSAPDEPWLQPGSAAKSLSTEQKRLFEATERFRLSVVERKARDRYDWQTHMLRYLVAHRDSTAKPLSRETLLMLRRSANAVRKVEKLSVSTDPFVVDPPADPGLHRAWLSLRERRIAPLELELDSMLHSIHKGHVPELQDEEWYGRFVSCLMACETYFEERSRLGEGRATNREVVTEQWDRVLLAADALDSLAAAAEPKHRD